MPEVRVAAQAKINLRLKILAREEGGYHSIETIFARIDLADDVLVRVGGSGRSIDCKGADVGPPEKNLAFRAAMAYAETTGWPEAFSIEITKKIPIGGGLGGGSSDAGAVLRALDAMSPLRHGPRLVALAAELGADVAFLTLDCPLALAWSRGERLMPLPTLPMRYVVIVTPDHGIATADAYSWVAESRMGFSPTAFIIDAAAPREWARMAAIATNDFDAVVFNRFPELRKAAAAIRQNGALVCMLAGSGSSVIGVFEDHQEAENALTATGMTGLITRTSMSVAPIQITK
jgi:4-diphosphocytidyl-2-C-methyl-D-erythritol kinase